MRSSTACTRTADVSSPTWNVVRRFALAMVLLLPVASLIPSPLGATLSRVATQVTDFARPLAEARGGWLEIDVIRDSFASRAGQALALHTQQLLFSERSEPAATVLAQLHSREAFRALSGALAGHCTVIASSEASILPELEALIGAREAALRLAVAHEAAHCLRNLSDVRSRGLAQGLWVEANPLANQLFARYLNESYADAFSVATAAALDAEGSKAVVRKVGERLVAYRLARQGDPAYRTEGAVAEAVRMLVSRAPGPLTVQEADAIALHSALVGRKSWLAHMRWTGHDLSDGYLVQLQSLLHMNSAR
ncbi:hypothetical protein ACSFA0_23615 [Variovorax sp. LT1P1]|uniref:hypothetical protein n=1 Tax=Variovorax sp. LT1P1 TaxID=3443730 RepID=UPI003F46D251